MRQLFLGGASSGKSRLAEESVLAWQQKYPEGQVTYVATTRMDGRFGEDTQLQQRINQHAQRRPNNWQLIEEPKDLNKPLALLSANETTPQCLLVECLTMWLTNWLLDIEDEAQAVAQTQQAITTLVAMLDSLQTIDKHHNVVLVSNELGSGIVPMGAISRHFQSLSGNMNQQVAKAVDKVTLVTAGLPLVLKDEYSTIST